MTPKAIQPKIQPVEAKAPELKPVFEAAKVDTAQPNQPKRPKEDVKVGTMSSGNATPATVKAPVEKVQTGGFGDPAGLPGKGNPNAHLIVNAQGLPTLPGKRSGGWHRIQPPAGSCSVVVLKSWLSSGCRLNESLVRCEHEIAGKSGVSLVKSTGHRYHSTSVLMRLESFE